MVVVIGLVTSKITGNTRGKLETPGSIFDTKTKRGEKKGGLVGLSISRVCALLSGFIRELLPVLAKMVLLMAIHAALVRFQIQHVRFDVRHGFQLR
jgi:hypothetical protein